MAAAGNGKSQAAIYVTQAGLPLKIELHWPFRQSTAGADFWYLHADLALQNTEGLHARIAVNLSATVREVLPSLEARDAEAPVINALRKDVDRKQIEFLKSAKLVPVHFSSRHYDFKRGKWIFGKVSDEEIETLLARKTYWQTRSGQSRVWLGDPTEALYVESSPEHLLKIAFGMARKGLLTLDGEYATAKPSLMDSAPQIEHDMQAALRELELKHEFERG